MLNPNDDQEAQAEDVANSRAQEAESLADDAARADAASPPFQDGRILGVNRRYYPMQGNLCWRITTGCDHIDGQCGNPPPTLAVLVQGQIGDYACYVGHGTPEWVKAHGDKIGFEEACVHFPRSLNRELYRS